MFGELADGAVTRLEKERAMTARNQIAELMWRDYLQMQGVVMGRGLKNPRGFSEGYGG